MKAVAWYARLIDHHIGDCERSSDGETQTKGNNTVHMGPSGGVKYIFA